MIVHEFYTENGNVIWCVVDDDGTKMSQWNIQLGAVLEKQRIEKIREEAAQ